MQSADFSSYPYLQLFTYDEPLAEPEVNPIPGLFIDDTAVVVLSSPADNSENVSLTPLFEWNAADGADSYDLVVSPNSDFSDPVIDESGITETEFQTVDDLSFSTTYNWRARGRNAAGPGEWSESFSFTTRGQPEAADRRILIANNASYTFTPTDFGQSDNSAFVVIDDLTGGLNGVLEGNGSSVAAGDEISVGDVDNGNLTYTPESGSYGYGADRFEFSIKDNEGNVSSESYTISLDVAATSAELTGSEGWRFMTTPSAGDTYQNLLSGITVDLNFPARQTLYELDQENYEWDSVGSKGDEPGVGTPFIIYVLEDDLPNLPISVESGINWLDLDGSYSYPDLDFTTGAPNPDSFYLLGNPHPIALDFCEFTSDNIAVSASFWDPAAGAGNGDYITLSCAVDERSSHCPVPGVLGTHNRCQSISGYS